LHARYFASEADRHNDLFATPQQLQSFEWFVTELPNLRAAFRWSVDRGDLDTAAASPLTPALSATGALTTSPSAGLRSFCPPRDKCGTPGFRRCWHARPTACGWVDRAIAGPMPTRGSPSSRTARSDRIATPGSTLAWRWPVSERLASTDSSTRSRSGAAVTRMAACSPTAAGTHGASALLGGSPRHR